MAKLGVSLEPELEKRFRDRTHALDISHQDALVQAVQLWMGQDLIRPELPERMTREEALICTEMVMRMRSSEEMKKFIPRVINLLRVFAEVK